MFDVGFSELVLIAVVALVVIGPERLPKVARTLGALVGRMRNYVATVKVEVEREMQLEDLKKLQQEWTVEFLKNEFVEYGFLAVIFSNPRAAFLAQPHL